jgi:homoserine acetyltransferase
MSDDYQTYKLGTFALKSGGEIPDAFIAYKTLGDPSLPAVIYPTWYSGCILYVPDFVPMLANLNAISNLR